VKLSIKLILFFLIAPVFSTVSLFGQNSKELDKKKQENISQLNYSRALLEKTEKSKISTLNQLTLIQQNIFLGSYIVDNISQELIFLKSDIEVNKMEIYRLEEKIKKLKEDYASLIVSASRNLDNDYAMMYLFSSGDLNQAYQRIRYLKFLTKYREDLVAQLLQDVKILSDKKNALADSRVLNERLLVERRSELRYLDQDKLKSLSLVKRLQSKESELKKEIQKRERVQAEIEREIRRMIEEEAIKAKASRKSSIFTAEELLISSDFTKNKGRLPWPSETGVLTGKYGEQNHPVLKGIKINSNGIDINTIEGARIRSIFDGEVTKVIAILGANYTVIIKHGDFRTVYQNLVDVRVKAGDKVKTKTIIGTVFTDQQNVSKFHFEIWKDKETQNPESWLAK